jgi:hypothetical protein
MLLNKLLFPNEKEEGRCRRHRCFMYFCEINEKFNTKCDKISRAHIQSALYKAAAVVERDDGGEKRFYEIMMPS